MTIVNTCVVAHLTRKSNAWTMKGVTIHWAVRNAQVTWPSSNRKRKVAKSVRTSAKPKITLKNVNLMIANILQSWKRVIPLPKPGYLSH